MSAKEMLPASFLKNFTGEGLTGAACDGSRNTGEERIPPALLHLGVARVRVSHGPGGCCPAGWTVREVKVSERQELSLAASRRSGWRRVQTSHVTVTSVGEPLLKRLPLTVIHPYSRDDPEFLQPKYKCMLLFF